jgi:hypothetical protein
LQYLFSDFIDFDLTHVRSIFIFYSVHMSIVRTKFHETILPLLQ